MSACEHIMLQTAPSSCVENVAPCHWSGYRRARADAIGSGNFMPRKQPVLGADRNREMAP